MLVRIGLIFTLLLTGFAVAETCGTTDAVGKQFLTIKLYEESEPAKVLLETTVQSAQDGELRSFSGGELPSDQSEEALQFGVRVTGRIKPAEQDQFRVVLKLNVGEAVHSSDPSTQVIRTQTIDIRSELKPGVTKRIHCGDKQWLELQLD